MKPTHTILDADTQRLYVEAAAPLVIFDQQRAYREFKWRALTMHMGDLERPRGTRAWLGWAWGQDLWLHGVPLIKAIVVTNFLMWALLWITR